MKKFLKFSKFYNFRFLDTKFNDFIEKIFFIIFLQLLAMLKLIFLLSLTTTFTSSQLIDFITPAAINSVRGDVVHVINEVFDTADQFYSFGEDVVDNFMSNFDRSAENAEEISSVNCPSALLVSCDPPAKIIPTLAYENRDGSWDYCTEKCCYRF